MPCLPDCCAGCSINKPQAESDAADVIDFFACCSERVLVES